MGTVPQSKEAIAKVNGVELAYDTFGDPSDAPLLLVMGLGAQMIRWHEAFCKLLAGKGYWVVRFDNRDAGKSTKFEAAGEFAVQIGEVVSGSEGPLVEVVP